MMKFIKKHRLPIFIVGTFILTVLLNISGIFYNVEEAYASEEILRPLLVTLGVFGIAGLILYKKWL